MGAIFNSPLLKFFSKIYNISIAVLYVYMDVSVNTWRIVSKLKVRPFQRVNSPLEAPVTNLLPSGVHCIITDKIHVCY